MKQLIIILISLSMSMMGCIPMVVKKQIIPVDPLAKPRFVEKEISIKVRVKSNEKSLVRAVKELNDIYGDPSVEMFTVPTKDGDVVIKKLYYTVDAKVFSIVTIVNDKVKMIDTVHSPENK